MTIRTHYTKTGNVSRMVDIPDTEQQELSVIYEDVPLHFQPLDGAFSQDIDNSYGKDFLMFTNNQNIEQGDRITIDNEEYRVMSKKDFNFLNRNRHSEYLIRLFK